MTHGKTIGGHDGLRHIPWGMTYTEGALYPVMHCYQAIHESVALSTDKVPTCVRCIAHEHAEGGLMSITTY